VDAAEVARTSGKLSLRREAVMRIVIAAVGRLKPGPERELAERYRKRAADAGRSVGLQNVDLIEIKDSRADNASRRMLEESIAIANVIPERAACVLLDEARICPARRSPGACRDGGPRHGRPRCSLSAGPTGSPQACASAPISPSRSGPPLGRISSRGSCCWNSCTGP
jgi:hypothetical protein